MSVKNRLNDLDQRINRLCVERLRLMKEYTTLGEQVARFEAQRDELIAKSGVFTEGV